MEYQDQAYRQPYRHGDYRLVDTGHQGTYWQCADGMQVRLASSESGRADDAASGAEAVAAGR
ncbi:MAG: hypothetical protein ACM3QY_04025 [Candidatus Levyibacteriota bacterium]